CEDCSADTRSFPPLSAAQPPNFSRKDFPPGLVLSIGVVTRASPRPISNLCPSARLRVGSERKRRGRWSPGCSRLQPGLQRLTHASETDSPYPGGSHA